jgi:hypothetical protein
VNTEQRIHPGLPSSICLLCLLTGQGQHSSRSLPGEQDGTSRQRAAKPNHTLRKTLSPFGTRCRRAAAMQLPIRFGRIAYKSNPTQSVSLSLCFTCAVPPDTAQREAPTLVTSYCATQRHCLHIPLVFRLPAGFPGPMFIAAQVLSSCFIDYEPRLHAYGSTLLRTAPSWVPLRV